MNRFLLTASDHVRSSMRNINNSSMLFSRRSTSVVDDESDDDDNHNDVDNNNNDDDDDDSDVGDSTTGGSSSSFGTESDDENTTPAGPHGGSSSSSSSSSDSSAQSGASIVFEEDNKSKTTRSIASSRCKFGSPASFYSHHSSSIRSICTSDNRSGGCCDNDNRSKGSSNSNNNNNNNNTNLSVGKDSFRASGGSESYSAQENSTTGGRCCQLSDDQKGTNNNDDDEQMKHVVNVAQIETQSIRIWRAWVVRILVGIVAAISYTTYTLAHHRNGVTDCIQHSLHQFNVSAQSIEYNIHQRMNQMYLSSQTLSRAITSQSIDTNEKFPFVDIQSFEGIAYETRVPHGLFDRVWYSPIVDSKDYMRWIDYSTSRYSWPTDAWNIYNQINPSNYYNATQYKEMFSQPLDPVIFQYIPNYPYDDSSRTITTNNNLIPWISEESIDDIFVPTMYMSPPPTVPGEIYPYMNMNCYTDETLKSLCTASAKINSIVFSSIISSNGHVNNTESIITIPVYPNYIPLNGSIPKGSMDVVAYVFAVISWQSELLHLLQKKTTTTTTTTNSNDDNMATTKIGVVLKNTCGQSFTYELYDSEILFIGENNIVHDKTYETYTKTIILSKGLVIPTSNNDSRYNTTNNTNPGYCEYYIEIYPIVQCHVVPIESTIPLILAISATVMFTLIIVFFLFYDRIVQTNNEKAITAAIRSSALVSSLFPSNVRDRLLQEKEDEDNVLSGLQKKQNNNKNNNNNNNVKFRNLRSFLPGHIGSSGGGAADQDTKLNFQSESFSAATTTTPPCNNNNTVGDGGSSALEDILNTPNGLEIYKSKPIADFFPEATVLFGDIVGFTAWSSVREPTQVFTLLETVYHAFDDIARRRRVFKVETVGDCYVAVCGLPDPRKDHAVTMCRFARDCMFRMWALVKKLETTLGPDTSDLTMRMGLHSGPVTAGVLRGERSRFQLFGDTVNTAARMEHNGVKSKIQISEETAAILLASGKRSWVTLREDKIVAKGKGEMQTYWLELGGNNVTAEAPGIASYSMEVSDQIKKMVKDVECSNNGIEESNITESPKNVKPVCSDKVLRLVGWNVEILLRLIKQIVARRQASVRRSKSLPIASEETLTQGIFGTEMVLDEVKEIIELPQFDAKVAKTQLDLDSIELDARVPLQLEEYVMTIGSGYRDNAFHNFEHAAHVTMSVVKLLSRIIAPSQHYTEVGTCPDDASSLHDHTYGITSDPLTQFSCVLSALIHDLDHPGVPNAQLVKESTPLAQHYKNKSVAEQNSVDMAWTLLMQPRYKELRAAIYTTEIELRRFRQLVVNSVMATDIVDKELKGLRNARWDKAFSQDEEAKLEVAHDQINRKATIVIEHLIQASDVAHTMQHWHIYRKWNERFFIECYTAYKMGRAETDPSTNWYQGEIGFFDFYIIPLAKKLKNCGVFGVSCDEYLNYALMNRQEWETRGQVIVHEMTEKVKTSWLDDARQ